MSVKLLVTDVDGTLTDGCIYMSADGETVKAFNVKDGYGIAHILPENGITPVIITGRKSTITEKRAFELGIKFVYQDVSDKLEKLCEILGEQGITADEVAYIGDDLNDLECIKYCALSACPGDAHESVKEAVDYICCNCGGKGAVREFIDYIVKNRK